MKLVNITSSALILIASLSAFAVVEATPTPAAVAPQATPAIDKAAKERARIEELFIWKASEELKLSASDETKFTEIIRNFNTRRRAANVKMDEALSTLGKVKTKAEAEKALTQHRSALREMQSLQTGEIDQLKPLLGAQKLAQYLVVKNSILEKLKVLLSAPTPTAPQAAATPENSSTK